MAECVCEIIMYEWVSKYIYLEYAPCPASQNKKSKKNCTGEETYWESNFIRQTFSLDWKLIRDEDVFAI